MKQPGLHVVYAAAVQDAAGTLARPGAVMVFNGAVQYVGDPAGINPELVQRAEIIDKRDCLLLPAMVNAHTHLELTAIGPQPYEPDLGFMGWVKMLRSHWPNDPGPGKLPEPTWFIDAAKQGSRQAIDAGVQSVGDISRLAQLADERRSMGLGGVTYLELFGMGAPFDASALSAIQSPGSEGLQPHAPYSAGPSVFAAAARSGRRLSTHLAETLDECAFVSECSGPKLDFIRSIGRWDNTFAQHYGQGLSPVQWMRPHLQAAASAGGWLVAHCNYVDDDDIKILADTNTSVAYCPIASEYFGHKDHRYRDMLAAGINVCLGTDSIVGTDPDDPQPLGLLSAMRRLYQRDATDPETLLEMATTRGARAMRLPSDTATLQRGAPARFACIQIDPGHPTYPLTQVLGGQQPVEALSFE